MDHRQLGVDLFNATWELIESRADDELMLNRAQASAYHWSQAPECTAANRARAAWLNSYVSALCGLADAARFHAERCLASCEENDLADWDLAFAYEALARAAKVAGDEAAAARFVEQARAVTVADAGDLEHLEEALATI